MDQATGSAASAIQLVREWLIEDAMECQSQRVPELRGQLNKAQRRAMAQDTRSHLDYITSALRFQERALLNDHAVWCKVLFYNLNLPAEWIEVAFECIADAVDKKLPPAEAGAARAYIEESLEVFAATDPRSTGFAKPEGALDELAQLYLRAALEGNRDLAVSLVADAISRNVPVKDIYRNVFQKVQREVGRLWLTNQLTVAQEHFITGVTQLAMARLYEHIFSGERPERTVVVACVGSELHELGARMVADFFEMDGWGTHYLGANTPTSAVVEAVQERKADVLALSATMAYHIDEVADVIADVRSDPTTASLYVLAGGYPFDVAPDLWLRVGADGTAQDADAAVRLARTLVGAAQGVGSVS
jgi:MerR family transcriptional regulator, light-induced transcriptional regulator